MKLVEFCVKNFKSIEEASLRNIGPFNILVGRNNVGKSNLLDALEIFLRNLGRDGQSSLDGQVTQDGLGDSISFSTVFHFQREEVNGAYAPAIQPHINRGDVSEEIHPMPHIYPCSIKWKG